MQRAVILLLTALLAVSCLGRSERIKVDIDKALPLGVIYDGSNFYWDGRVILRYTLR